MSTLELSLIVAMTSDRIIGKDGELPWRMPSDLARFKQITTDIGVVIMGRKTFDSILTLTCQPLPKREHVVLTHQMLPNGDHVHYVRSVEEACDVVATLGNRACIIGGAEIYEAFICARLVQRVYLTVIHAWLAGDTRFPQFVREANTWHLADGLLRNRHSPKDEHDSSFWTFETREAPR